MSRDKTCVVLVSGGLDSAVTLAMARAAGFRAHALTILYGQRHAIELGSAERVCQSLGVVTHQILNIDLRAFGGSSLTTNTPVPKEISESPSPAIPSTYVPARNTVFLSLALSFAEALCSRDIFIGVSAVDYSGYPDCRPAFIESFQQLANVATRAVDGGERFAIHAPLIRLSKAATVLEGLRLGVDFSLTWSCYDPQPNGRPCELCASCRLRAKGFREAGVPDPLLAALSWSARDRDAC